MEDVTAPMELETEGRAGAAYDLAVWNAELIESVEGGELVKDAASGVKLRVHFGGSQGSEYVHQRVLIHLNAQRPVRKKRSKE